MADIGPSFLLSVRRRLLQAGCSRLTGLSGSPGRLGINSVPGNPADIGGGNPEFDSFVGAEFRPFADKQLIAAPAQDSFADAHVDLLRFAPAREEGR